MVDDRAQRKNEWWEGRKYDQRACVEQEYVARGVPGVQRRRNHPQLRTAMPSEQGSYKNHLCFV